jgi:hypothetical protein
MQRLRIAPTKDSRLQREDAGPLTNVSNQAVDALLAETARLLAVGTRSRGGATAH